MIDSNTAALNDYEVRQTDNEAIYEATKDRLGEHCIAMLYRLEPAEFKRTLHSMEPEDTLEDFALTLYAERAELELREEYRSEY